MQAPEQKAHRSGLVLQRLTGPKVSLAQSHRLDLPRCCPISGNPAPGSTLRLTYQPDLWCLEVYALESMVESFVGGFDGAPGYDPDRNMEGMIATLAQMAADATGVPVKATARLVLDAGRMTVRCHADPR